MFGYLSVNSNLLIYFICALSGVSLHLFTDLLNGYGVQLLWPFQRKWLALGITYTFDAVLLISHLLAFALIYVFNFDTLTILSFAYAIIIIYIIMSYFYHLYLKKQLILKYGKYKRLILQAKATPFAWKYVYETTDKHFYMGKINKKEIIELKSEIRQEFITKELETTLAKNKDLQAFLNFTPIFNYHITHIDDDFMKISFYDLRYLMVRKTLHIIPLIVF